MMLQKIRTESSPHSCPRNALCLILGYPRYFLTPPLFHCTQAPQTSSLSASSSRHGLCAWDLRASTQIAKMSASSLFHSYPTPATTPPDTGTPTTHAPITVLASSRVVIQGELTAATIVISLHTGKITSIFHSVYRPQHSHQVYPMLITHHSFSSPVSLTPMYI